MGFLWGVGQDVVEALRRSVVRARVFVFGLRALMGPILNEVRRDSTAVVVTWGRGGSNFQIPLISSLFQGGVGE